MTPRTAAPPRLATQLPGFALGVALALGLARPGHAEPALAEAPRSPALVVMVTVDQMRADYLTKLHDHWTGGFRRLLDRGVVFTEAHHGHALTLTAPGHASIATGRHPSAHGIVGNQWRDREGGAVYCVEDAEARLLRPDGSTGSPGSGRSPRLLLVDSLPDWLQAVEPLSRAWSIGGKDRATVLTGGRHPDGALWYDRSTGAFVTSSWYRSSLPDWLHAFNARDLAGRHCGTTWTPLPAAGPVAQAFELRPTDTGDLHRGFPHAFGGLDFSCGPSYYGDVIASPFLADLLVELSKAVIAGEELGRDEVVDFLAVNFSSLDHVGHRYGPQSPEVLDTLLRLDHALGDLLDHLDEAVGRDRWVLALTSDHGVVPFPELGAAGAGARRLAAADVACFQVAERALDERLGDGDWLRGRGDVHLDYEALGRHDLRRSRAERVAAEVIRSCSAVRDVFTRTELLASRRSGRQRPYLEAYRNTFHPDRSGDLLVQLHEGHLESLHSGTTHGSPYRYDTHVPLAFLVPGARPMRVDEPVQTVDVAPTLADLVGVAPPGDVDGVSLVSRWR